MHDAELGVERPGGGDADGGELAVARDRVHGVGDGALDVGGRGRGCVALDASFEARRVSGQRGANARAAEIDADEGAGAQSFGRIGAMTPS